LDIPELPSIKVVSDGVLKKSWSKISEKPIPELAAFTLNDEDFKYFLELVQKNPSFKDTRVMEYGVSFGNKFIEAFSFETKKRFIIIIRQSAPLVASLKHEFKHILDDIKSDRKQS
jgi:hypothetical protein